MAFKTTNVFADNLGDFYADTPKAVFAALAVELIGEDPTNNPAPFDSYRKELIALWQKMQEGGIIPQPVPKRFASELAEYRRIQENAD